MTREEAIEKIEKYQCKRVGTVSESELEEALNMAIEALTEPEWIPITERLPEQQKKSYWICTDCGYQCECRWTNWHWHFMDVPQYQKVVAWMPLPEPYEGSDTE